ncbi:cell division protein FtsZ [Candidatus Roizmanbacteria bacterium RIFCSPLOWO2_01_FULL_42_14]|uniref:Cell division protein FtsZ n=4 Tax=Candidatus Roizmaniibacteriota TaxID=1752723 RepID=A0A1F7JTQ7_9BACT|nr:MAG: cell division protein FtsZ [Candidatus Roizmanbacteria bacterium RIFCSPHIGHO2_02_FULL_43_11]OGK51545.1 MAG: cell division protein FtsZ [Candidatus Roizmanbacteria bacterium RIFCSPLOWO2_01_FULL_42_14]OGK58990.1 MAG: cell division protein FtsZ [Candidatus Roizmanbacteria bacterium RIFCSPLOWO2_02_FULL_43_10]
MLIKPHAGQPAKIKVVGVGGGGGNALATMIKEEDIKGVEFIAMNTDAQALLNHNADIKIQIGESLTKGLGSGGDPEIGRQAAEESREKIKEYLDGADMVFIAAGEGGGTGTGAAPIIAEISREVEALTVAVVTRPFVFEGSRRKVTASEGIDDLKDKVDTLIVIPNQRVLEIVDSKVSILEAFKKVDSVLHQGVKGIAELITVPGLINVDFADVRTIMKDAGTALMGIGTASGENRTINAIKQAISSPLLESSISGAKGVLFNIVGGADLSMTEVDEAASVIAKTVDPDADIIFGAVIDEKMMDQVRITVIATRIDEGRLRLSHVRDHARPISQDAVDTRKEEISLEPEPRHMLRKGHHEEEKRTRQFSSEEDNLVDEDEFGVPAFLRRKI